MRTGQSQRTTRETDIAVRVTLDGTGQAQVDSGNGFFDHMLTLLAAHGGLDVDVSCKGDTQVDFHHSCEDIGICLGQALKDALGSKQGIARYADLHLPMDEALVLVALDVSGRGGAYLDVPMAAPMVGAFDTELLPEFLIAFAREAGLTLHVRLLCGRNAHHIIEAVFKALGRALKAACREVGGGVPSTKGVL
ncbi:MAG TPA: imidazoleglycerol-phosphate dehydratase HisB [Clostridiales bacterium]|nr:imidazoleglycerol-phosphate dehydratase HisB [Clostridiales bacterium]